MSERNAARWLQLLMAAGFVAHVFAGGSDAMQAAFFVSWAIFAAVSLMINFLEGDE